MTLLPQSAWRYAVLIIILFAIVAVASMTIISYLHDQITEQSAEETIKQLTIAIWALTMGFMFLAGALGLWAIRSTAEIEGRRRVGRFVDTMDYLSDGLLAVDSASRVRGANPAARKLYPHPVPADQTVKLGDVFRCLTEDDVHQLTDAFQTYEIEKDCVYRHGLRTLRFRSQLSEGLTLILVSDITAHHSLALRRRQVAQLQVVGRLAAGVAHDFNNILGAISGHATLLQRFKMDPEGVQQSLKVIADETQKGVLLSRQLLGLSRSGTEGRPSENLAGNVSDAAALLRIALSPEWFVKPIITGSFPAVPLAPAQVEQVVLNLGMLAADAQARPGTVTISLNRPGQGLLLDVGDQYEAVILVSGESALPAENQSASQSLATMADDGGVVFSVVKTIVEEANGHLDQLVAAGGACVYRVCLPHLDIRSDTEHFRRLPIEQVSDLISRWQIMLAGTGHEAEMIATHLANIGARVARKADILSILTNTEQTRDCDALVMGPDLLRQDAGELLRALRELYPQLGIVVLGLNPGPARKPDLPGIVYLSRMGNLEHVLRSLLAAHSSAASSTT